MLFFLVKNVLIKLGIEVFCMKKVAQNMVYLVNIKLKECILVNSFFSLLKYASPVNK